MHVVYVVCQCLEIKHNHVGVSFSPGSLATMSEDMLNSAISALCILFHVLMRVL